MHNLKASFPIFFVLTVAMLLPQPAMAYIGPGAGLSAIGAVLAAVAGIFVALFGFVWYPVRRIIRNKRRQAAKRSELGE